MRELEKSLLASSVIAAIVSAGTSYLTTSWQFTKEFHTKEIQSGYEELIKANAAFWNAGELERQREEAATAKDTERARDLTAKAKKFKDESDLLYTTARHRIAAYGDKSVVRSLSHYYSQHHGANRLCKDKTRFKDDVEIYKAIRTTVGVGGDVDENDLASVLFSCSLK